MRKKIISLLLILAICIPNFSFAMNFEFTRSGGSSLEDNVTKITDTEKVVDSKYNAKSEGIKWSDVQIYKYGTTEKMTNKNNTSDVVYDYNDSEYYLEYSNNSTHEALYATMLLGTGDQTKTNVASIVYENALTYMGEQYDVRIDIDKILKSGSQKLEIQIARLGFSRTFAATNKYDPENYINEEYKVFPTISIGREFDTSNKESNTYNSGTKEHDYQVEISLTYTIIDKDKKETKVSGIYKIADIDVSQGVFTKDFNISKETTYIKNSGTDLKYKNLSDGSYIYTELSDNTPDTANVYLQMEDINNIKQVYTWDGHPALCAMNFDNSNVKDGKTIKTEVVNGTITPSTIVNIGDDKKIEYAPDEENKDKLYLKSVTVNDEEVTPIKNDEYDYTNEYTFKNVTEDQEIKVVYDEKLLVQHLPMNDTPAEENPYEDQYVIPGENATKPTNDPTWEGHTFLGWYEKGSDTPFEYDDENGIQKDTTIEAHWKDNDTEEYPIEYYDNDTKEPIDITGNPDKYTEDDLPISFKNPTKEGYTFIGWYTNPENSETKTTGISKGTTGKVVVYAKWEKDSDVDNEYTIEYELNGGTNNPANPSKYTEKKLPISFEMPTREGYTFLGWYTDENFTTKTTGIPQGTTGNIKVYAKWEENGSVTEANYTVEYYLEADDGKYVKDTNNSYTSKAEIDKTVTAKTITYTGYTENTKHEDRISSGKVKSDGSLVLKLFYDKKSYTVKFDPKGGTPDPADQTVKYQDKATEPTDPTKEGYKFKYWYYLNDDDEKIPYDFDKKVTEDVQLYAEWQKNVVNTTPKDDKEDNTVTNGKEDPTTAKQPLSNTGLITTIAIPCMLIIAAVLGFRYFKFRDI